MIGAIRFNAANEFFSSKMRDVIKPQLKDAKRLFGAFEREIIYYRDQKKCAVLWRGRCVA